MCISLTEINFLYCSSECWQWCKADRWRQSIPHINNAFNENFFANIIDNLYSPPSSREKRK